MCESAGFEARLRHFVRPGTARETLLVCDFDGTLYRGLFPWVTRGIANADLGLVLAGLHLAEPARAARLVRELLRLAVLDRLLLRRYRAGEITLSDKDRRLIEFFTVRVLAPCEENRIRRAAQMVARWCDPEGWATLSALPERCAAVIVSKSFALVLEAACDRFGCRNLASVPGYGVRLDWTSGVARLDRANSVLTRADKAACIRRYLGRHPQYRQVLVVGDTEDDLGLRAGAQAVLSPDCVVTIALHARDRVLRAEADAEFRSWRAFRVAMGLRK